MFESFEQASEVIVDAMGEVFPLGYPKRAYVKSIIKRDLKVDTNSNLHRVDFLSKERIIRALQDQSDIALRETLRTLFPRTMKVVESSR